MVKRKRKSGVWHHRVPDFQLVYCGPEEHVPQKETKLAIRRRLNKVSVMAEECDVSDTRSEQQKRRDLQ